ncbi:twitching motility protein PilT [Scytonema hofmannii PCC 7110]|uniref:Twitching motility protein PilT n=1 Tax=Scytonema hofmannii PCC 7110 TaxID=128403 RepID=A0A139X6A8_9CYAN|nr:PIN domain-containing protein [Scytonema hofmannii]KYC40173.1 twitching motility protein PilT [Scytonema hofmannii PCC 7110]
MTVSRPQPVYFIDTNVWFYALTTASDDEDSRKSEVAKSLLQLPNIVLSTQVINEVCTNLLKKARIPEQEISNLITSFYRKYRVVNFYCEPLLEASNLRTQYYFSFWDSLLVASALDAGAHILYSEDMQDGLLVFGKLQIVNPFKL